MNPKQSKVKLVFVSQGINIPSLGLSIGAGGSLAPGKIGKNVSMYETDFGVELTNGTENWTVPYANIRAYQTDAK